MDNATRKVAVVTGGSMGIGKAICLSLAKDGCDIAFLYVGDRDAAAETVGEIEALGAKAKAYYCDVSSYGEVEETFGQVKADFPTFDILVNNAGITNDKLLLSMKPEDFTKVIDINLVGVFNVTKQVYPVLAKKRSGRIVNISSIAGIMGNAGQANYASSKAGVIGFTKTIARELAGRNVTCNAIAPGFIATSMTTAFQESDAAKNSVPLGRFAVRRKRWRRSARICAAMRPGL